MQAEVIEITKIEKNADMFWGFAYLRSRTEKVVKDKLSAKNILVYLPMIPKARMHHSTKIVTYVPMIPGYIFLCINDPQRSDLLCDETHIVHLELCRNRAIEDQLIRDLNILQKCEAIAQNEQLVVNPEIVSGDQVIITEGELKGLEATVCRRDDANNVIIINLMILNKHIEYPISVEKLEKITR